MPLSGSDRAAVGRPGAGAPGAGADAIAGRSDASPCGSRTSITREGKSGFGGPKGPRTGSRSCRGFWGRRWQRRSSESGCCTSETVKGARGGSRYRGRWRARTRRRDARCSGSGSFPPGGGTRMGQPASVAAIICTNRRCSGPWPRRCGEAGSRSGQPATRCGTRSPRTCWRVVRTSGRCRSCSVIATSRPPCCTPMCSTGAGSVCEVLRTVQDCT